MKYTITNDSVTVITDGKTSLVRSGAPNFAVLCKALRHGDASEVRAALSSQDYITAWHPRFTIEAGAVCFDRKPVAASFGKRVLAMVTGGEDPQPLLRFYERLSRNPSWRSTQQLFDFLAHENLPIEPSGHFLAYKAVRRDYTDIYSGSVSNAVGQRPTMPRNQISDDADLACHVGFHVGALKYAQDFIRSGQAGIEGAPPYVSGSGRIVVCRVDPEHVVCVPKDASYAKVRVCEYLVIGNFGQALPSTTMSEETSEEERQALYQGVTDAVVAQLVAMSRDELVKYLRRHMHVVGPLPDTRYELLSLAMDVSR